jgi:hypothetical protein
MGDYSSLKSRSAGENVPGGLGDLESIPVETLRTMSCKFLRTTMAALPKMSQDRHRSALYPDTLKMGTDWPVNRANHVSNTCRLEMRYGDDSPVRPFWRALQLPDMSSLRDWLA